VISQATLLEMLPSKTKHSTVVTLGLSMGCCQNAGIQCRKFQSLDMSLVAHSSTLSFSITGSESCR